MQETLMAESMPARTRLIVRKGIKNLPLKLGEVALFYTESKVVYAIDKNNNKYLCDKNLGELEVMLDPKLFFRANRQYIININFIKTFQAFERVKLQVELAIGDANYEITISQLTMAEFKKWVAES